MELSHHASLIPLQSLERCKVLACRENLLTNYLPCNCVVAEIGVFEGTWSKKILEWSNPKELHLVDVRCQPEFTKAYPSVRFYQGDSSTTVANSFKDNYFDWIYIDGDHRYAGVKKDVVASIPKLKPDGLLVFNDYILYDYIAQMEYGVVQVVNDLLQDGWEMKCIALTPSGFYDVVLGRHT